MIFFHCNCEANYINFHIWSDRWFSRLQSQSGFTALTFYWMTAAVNQTPIGECIDVFLWLADWIKGLVSASRYVRERSWLVNFARGRVEVLKISKLIGKIIHQYLKIGFNVVVLNVFGSADKSYWQNNFSFGESFFNSESNLNELKVIWSFFLSNDQVFVFKSLFLAQLTSLVTVVRPARSKLLSVYGQKLRRNYFNIVN